MEDRSRLIVKRLYLPSPLLVIATITIDIIAVLILFLQQKSISARVAMEVYFMKTIIAMDAIVIAPHIFYGENLSAGIAIGKIMTKTIFAI